MAVKWTPGLLTEGLRNLRDTEARTGASVAVLDVLDAAIARLSDDLPAATVRLETNTLFCEGRAILLTRGEAELAAVLCRHGYADYEKIIGGMWGAAANAPDDPHNVIKAYKCRIGLKLKAAGCRAWIKCHWGVGFEWLNAA
jgi:DNA-binding response OmpR family regulator